MAKAVRYHKQGGPEVLQVDEVQVGEPGPGQVRVRHTAIGVNFVDTYQRSGLYPMQLPAVAGNEGAGVVEAVGSGVKDLKKGDRVAYTGLPGSYCEVRLVPADRMVKIPKGISDEQAASMMLKGMTVHYLIHSTYKVKKGDTVLWHAAAGGVGLIAGQWLKKLGVTAIGTVGSRGEGEARQGARLQARHQLQHRELRREGEGDHRAARSVPVVYDAVGKTTWDGSLDCLQPRGLMVSFGNASGPVPPAEPRHPRRARARSTSRARRSPPTSRRAPTWSSARTICSTRSSRGKVKIETTARYKLADAAQAHRDLEGRKTTGSVVLIP